MKLEAEQARDPSAPRVEKPGHRRVGHVEGGGGWRDDRAGERRPAHVLEVNERVGRFAEREDERSALLQADVGGALEEIAGNAVGDRAERSGAARNDGHPRDRIGPGRDRGADVLVRVEDDSTRGVARQIESRDLVGR